MILFPHISLRSPKVRRNSLPINLSIANLLTPAFLAIGAMLCVVSQIEAAPIYSQILPEEPVGAFSSINAPGFQKVADNFILNDLDALTVRSVRFTGGVTGSSAAVSENNFRLVFFEDVGGEPGMHLPNGDFQIGPAYSQLPTDGQLLNGSVEPIEYVINLPSPVTLTTGTEFWVSISNDLLPDNGWVWARAVGNLDSSIATTTNDVGTGPWVMGSSSGGMFFELNDQYIPEPSSSIIIIVALVAATLTRSQKWIPPKQEF